MQEGQAGTFFGLERIVSGHPEMLAHFTTAVDSLLNHGFSRKILKRRSNGDGKENRVDYPRVLLADTFFSDTLKAQDLLALFAASRHHGVTPLILFLNPLSDQARIRALMLAAEDARNKRRSGSTLSSAQQRNLDSAETWGKLEGQKAEQDKILGDMLGTTLRRTHLGLETLCNALTAVLEETRAAQPDVFDDGTGTATDGVLDSLQRLQRLQERLSVKDWTIEVRFTSDLFVLPAYVVGPYVYRGFLMPRSSAVYKPWSIYRDDPERTDDTYELVSEAFTQAWEMALPIVQMQKLVRESADAERKVLMVAYSEANKGFLDQVARVISDMRPDIRLERFPAAVGTAEATRETLRRMLRSARAGIALLLPDERLSLHASEGTSPSTSRSRPNVVHETGLMQGTFGFERVLLLMQHGAELDLPSNLIGMHQDRLTIAANGTFSEAELRGVLARFFQELRM